MSKRIDILALPTTLAVITTLSATGCSTLLDPYASEKKLCSDLYAQQSDEYKSCVVELVAARPTTAYPSTISTNSGMTEQQVRETYRQERAREQILQHGAGGCTPNFATGGCL